MEPNLDDDYLIYKAIYEEGSISGEDLVDKIGLDEAYPRVEILVEEGVLKSELKKNNGGMSTCYSILPDKIEQIKSFLNSVKKLYNLK